jgi:hypothetical protein
MKRLLIAIVLGVVVLTAGCSSTTEPASDTSSTTDWRSFSFQDVNNNRRHSINQFKGKTIVLENFAVWCPTCTQQQKEIKRMIELGSYGVVHISLDTDVNEDAAIVKAHTERNGFDWIYAVAPAPLTRGLIDEFGVTVVNAPAAPVIIICPDGDASLLKQRGVKSAEQLLASVQAC